MDDYIAKMPVHERYALIVCAYRLDMNIGAEQFVEMLERYEKSIREDERRQLQKGDRD